LTAHQEFVEQIVELEWTMFIRVKSDRPAPCQSAPDNFKTIRGSIFDIWTDEMLGSYLNDLIVANEQGRNLLTEKYARMDNLVEPLSTNPVIEKIVAIECKWQEEIQNNYPALYEQCCRRTDPTGDGSNFSVYLQSELETYSDHTLGLYYDNVKNADDTQKNLALDALQRLVQKSGYTDLAHAENHLSKPIGNRVQEL
jgi:hypothetical protein